MEAGDDPALLIAMEPSSPSPAPASVSASASAGGDGAGAASSDTPTKYEEYEVELEKPIGLKFYKGQDGGVYIDAIAPGGGADKTKQFTPGDRVIATR